MRTAWLWLGLLCVIALPIAIFSLKGEEPAAPAATEVEVELDLTEIEARIESEMDSPDLAELCEALGRQRSEEAEGLLRRMIDESPNRRVRALATLNLGLSYQHRAGESGSDELMRRAQGWLKNVARDYADVVPEEDLPPEILAELARGTTIGRVALEIAGEDIDGVPFRLSDYLGKVVVLDFWGHW